MEFAVDGASGVDGHDREFGMMMTPTILLYSSSSSSSSYSCFSLDEHSNITLLFFMGWGYCILFIGCLWFFSNVIVVMDGCVFAGGYMQKRLL